MTTTKIPAGYCAVRGNSASAHLTEYVVGAHYNVALCGAAPTAVRNPVTHTWDGPAKWSELVIREYDGTVCPECLEKMK